ncbi:hypothetical protein BT69DRAFT_112307 [Atractiella rhizophila]|nr:hypothetical protein BT69DRAFT_112307 [Atractiella rhizophila]
MGQFKHKFTTLLCNYRAKQVSSSQQRTKELMLSFVPFSYHCFPVVGVLAFNLFRSIRTSMVEKFSERSMLAIYHNPNCKLCSRLLWRLEKVTESRC